MTTGFDINGKTALITGANRGIGLKILEAFLAGGAKKVYAAVRNPKSVDEIVQQHGGRVAAIEADLSKPDTIKAAAAAATDVQIVVNNGGVLKTASPLDPDAFDKFAIEMDINVYGLMRVAQAFAPVLKSNGGGALVQLNSIASVKNFADFATYCASKAASYSITQALRDKLAEQKTQVLSVHPGPIKTDMGTEAGFHEIADSPEMVADGIVKALKDGHFHLFPDTMAKQVGAAYQSFAENIVEKDLMEG